MFKKILLLSLIGIIMSTAHAAPKMYSEKVARSFIISHPDPDVIRWGNQSNHFTWQAGYIMFAMEKLWRQTNDSTYLNYIRRYVDQNVDAEGNEFELEDWQLSDFCERLAFALDEQMPMESPWPFKWDRYLMDTSFGNWFHADAQLLGYALEGKPERLMGAMADLGDPHETLEPSDITLMLRWYECFTDWLQERYPLVFKKAKPGEASTSSPVEARQNIMLMLNEGKPQDNQRIEDSKMHDVLAALQYKIEYAKQIEEKLQEIK